MKQPIFKHMELECKCGEACLKNSEEILLEIDAAHSPCPICSTIKLKKFRPLKDQLNLDSINLQWGRCECGKRHMDLVMAHILKIMIREEIQDEKSKLRSSAVPLITPAYPLKNEPYLGDNSLIVLASKMNEKCAEIIYSEVSEVKGVLKGEINNTVGIKDFSSSPHVYDLLAGCDLRCDILSTPLGPIGIHKKQSQIHIEVPRQHSPKITSLSLFLKNNNLNSDFKVLDATCGPGTLGIFCLKAGADKVVFNDLWKPATTMTTFNLESNGFKVDFFDEKLENCKVSYGKNFEIYNVDIRKIDSFVEEKFDLCIIDPFPGVDSKEFVNATRKLAKKTLII
ncbi:50S ribosomal protein L11 methyltransferase [Methanobacterium alkalithermotolerans]|nr:50S ribosomal protein L11 methyltransferase [Methanobacterium alkalithermotolerans]